ncbi:MAG: 2-oxoglutarate and iron-dependent oxygenase domain-containing protein [Acidimicrobiales bacterium]|jgi:isopenicillin N synthase-like dioxygenase|nr:2-oxoglutarate and iron-dependent oxygenase domain-containing protein [Acidimicrobiales bacterium]MDP6299046.1 2-oxoglutarate and iron-dependent oxygenase domain-containing protein [Acidimicrobiales bacterium]HJM98186.1 2-oxoglutarate and iron-dependent oxygenase domain-containing protein [Acidimicrobiales bacterium]
MSETVLDVDLLAFEQGNEKDRKVVIDGVMRSLKTGFVYTSHDMSQDFLDQVYEMLELFFTLSTEEKQTAAADKTNGQRGYTGLLVETAAISDVPDWKEMLNWGKNLPVGHPLNLRYPHRFFDNVFPEDLVPGITETLETFHEQVLELQLRFLRVIALGLNVSEGFFDSIVPGGANLTRAIHYPSMDLAPNSSHVWAEEHGDINLITALPRATARGLQIQGEDDWIDAAPPDDHLIINTGIMLEHLTNGVIPTGVHRVVADPAQPGSRMSIVQFCHPTPWTVLSPLGSCISSHNPQRYAPITAADRLDQVLWEINLLEDNRRVG